MVNGPLTIGGVVYFGTNRPAPAVASTADLGEARAYALSFLDGSGAGAPGGAGTRDDVYSRFTGKNSSPIASWQ